MARTTRAGCPYLLVAVPLFALGCAAETGVIWRAAPPETVAAPQQLPIGLDTVLRLAEEHNGQIALAREKVQEAYADQDLAHKTAWLPIINVGTVYYRHEGGIQNEDGTITRSSFGGVLGGMDVAGRIDLREAILAGVKAESKLWQQKGELSRITSETLLDAASTYIDLLSARTAEAVARRTLKDEQDALEQARGLAKADPGTRFVVEGFEAEAFILKQTIAKLRQQGDAAALKLAYLLGIGPDVQLVPVDSKLIPIELVDPKQPTEQLVGQALSTGPGVRELEQLLAAVQAARERAEGPSRFMPTVEMRAIEGLFGAGPGSTLDWANRFDFGVQARWNLTDLFTANEQKRLADSRMTQLQLAYLDARAKLTIGVQEAQQASLSGRDELKLAEDAMQHASEGYKLSNKRLKDNVPGSSPVEVMGYIRAMQAAYLNYVSVISAYNKAQLRLLVLTGAASSGHEPGCCR